MIKLKNNILLSNGTEDLIVNILNWNEKEVEYTVENTPVCQWDQHSRARIGIEFLDYKVSDEPKYILYTNIFNRIQSDNEFRESVEKVLVDLEEQRKMKSSFKDNYNLMSRCVSYRVKQTMESLKGQMARRLKFCEESFITGLHWLLRDKLIKIGCQAALEFLPSCDYSERCEYSSADYLSNMFGCLFAGCNRWPDKTEFASFNFSCTSRSELEKQLKINIHKSEFENFQSK